MAVHESQSLIIKMQACGSREFMDYLSKKLQRHFSNDPAFEPDNLYRLHTQVKRSLIRVDADEVTYPLHVLLRYEIENDLLHEKLTINDLPEIWNIKMIDYLNLPTQGNYKDGVMQDVHWPADTFGYFPAYTLGRLMASQFFASAIKQYPSIMTNLSKGNFNKLNIWLNQHVHKQASFFSNEHLLINSTNEALNPNYFIQHIKHRYLTETPLPIN